ncbi:hypothetical protein [Devosia sp.]|uniref:hypothetical protein n=1 Tax=Devosia sp. TaxID=1871048 RepID=UPI001AC30B50|nr:hypothetical protein [Devosia sp.]MBN9332554.1 hypothetical protein [Devosia sp.]
MATIADATAISAGAAISTISAIATRTAAAARAYRDTNIGKATTANGCLDSNRTIQKADIGIHQLPAPTANGRGSEVGTTTHLGIEELVSANADIHQTAIRGIPRPDGDQRVFTTSADDAKQILRLNRHRYTRDQDQR